MYTHLMLIFIKLCLLNVVFSMTKALNDPSLPWQNVHSSHLSLLCGIVLTNVTIHFSLQGCNHWCIGEKGGLGSPCSHPPTSFLNQTRFNHFSFKCQRYCLLRVLRYYIDQMFHNFHRVSYNFWIIYTIFSFFLTTSVKWLLLVGLSEKVRYSLSLWTIWKKIKTNKS